MLGGAVPSGAGFTGGTLSLGVLGYASYGAGLALIVRADLRERRIPNAVLAWTTVCTWVPLALLAVLARAGGALLVITVTCLAVGSVATAAWLRWPRAVGAGDVKLIPVTLFAALWPHALYSNTLWTLSLSVLASLACYALVCAVGLGVGAVRARLRGAREFAAAPIHTAASLITMVLALTGAA